MHLNTPLVGHSATGRPASRASVRPEADPRSFRGFWTYDAETVGDIETSLRETY